MDAIRLSSELVAQRHKTAAGAYLSLPAYQQLKQAGFVEDAGVVQSTQCDDCDSPHDAEVVFEGDTYGYYCPDLGFVAKDRLELVAVQFNISGFVENLANDLNCKRRKSSPVSGSTWRVGAIETHAGDISIYFHPILRDANDLLDLETALAKEARSSFGIVLTASGSISVAPFVTVALENCVSFDETNNQFCFDVEIEKMVGVPQIKTGGRPNIYKANIEKIMIARSRDGRSEQGRNAETEGILDEYQNHFPTEPVPSKSVVNRYVTRIRAGS